jgi:hypothetical protein
MGEAGILLQMVQNQSVVLVQFEGHGLSRNGWVYSGDAKPGK